MENEEAAFFIAKMGVNFINSSAVARLEIVGSSARNAQNL